MEKEEREQLIKEIVAEVIAQLPQGYEAGCRIVVVKGDLYGNILQGDNSQFVGSGAILNGNDVGGSINVNSSGSVVNSGNGRGNNTNTATNSRNVIQSSPDSEIGTITSEQELQMQCAKLRAENAALHAENKRLREEVERLREEFERLR